MAEVNLNNSVVFRIGIQLWDQICSHLQANIPEEGCGLIAGVTTTDPPGWVAQKIYPIENILHSQARYRMEARAQMEAFESLDQAGQELVGIFHSHPNGPTYPSQTDLIESHYPGVIYMIFTREGRNWQCSGYLLQDHLFEQVMILIS